MPDDKAEEGESGMKMRKNMAGAVIILALCTACLAAGCGSKAGKADETASGQAVKEAGPAYDKAAEYLHDYFGIEAGQDTTPENINGMIRALGGEPVSEELPNDGAVIEAGIKIAGLDELALTYINDEAPDKAAQVLEKAGIKPVIVDYWKRFPKAAFDAWYAGQTRFRNAEDRQRDAEAEKASMSMPEMARLLDVPRHSVYSILNSHRGREILDVIYT